MDEGRGGKKAKMFAYSLGMYAAPNAPDYFRKSAPPRVAASHTTNNSENTPDTDTDTLAATTTNQTTTTTATADTDHTTNTLTTTSTALSSSSAASSTAAAANPSDSQTAADAAPSQALNNGGDRASDSQHTTQRTQWATADGRQAIPIPPVFSPSTKRFRRPGVPGRRSTTSALVHNNQPSAASNLDLASSNSSLAHNTTARPSAHSRTSSGGVGSRVFHDGQTQRSLFRPFKTSHRKTPLPSPADPSSSTFAVSVPGVGSAGAASSPSAHDTSGSLNPGASVTPASAAAVTSTSIASAPVSVSASLSQRPSPIPTNSDAPTQGQTAPQSDRRHKRDPFLRRSSHYIHLPSTPASPARTSFSAGSSSPWRLRSRDSRDSPYHHAGLSGSFALMPTSKYPPAAAGRKDSATTVSGVSTMPSQDNIHASAEVASSNSAPGTSKLVTVGPKPFIVRNNRTYIHEPTLAYPLPVDLAELHRQSLRTLLTFQLFGGPIISSAFTNKPPQRVLEVGCGSAFWSMMCHRFFAQHGHSNIYFTGMDIVPLAGAGLDSNTKPDKDMRWRFVQHDVRKIQWPFADNEFDLIMVKDLSLANGFRDSQALFEEEIRVLKPGGVLEIWDTDHTIRMLRPHVLKTASASKRDDSDSSSDEEDEDNVTKLGAYIMTTNTPLSAPLNPFLVEYNGWATKALDAAGLSAIPCTLVGPWLLQESEILTDVRSKRLAVPLSEIKWEREGVGGVVTKDGKSYIDTMKGKGKAADGKTGRARGKTLSAAQSALRRTALETTVQQILSLEPLLREASGKSQDEWDGWATKMANDLLRDNGTSWGECLEIGAWTARKRVAKKP
ncbi:hypothetical protein F4780DRAFT_133187 [Xylariomycetidae sp. FL0641]|nr:hypothetical protein F4780DRAFT_133187 [Xylariomycetidae sp. FL0641]